ncbi:trypsin Inhibitor like cysteine rich domain protein [Ancylostoma caninum]|uniref:Trypsin Inhibitor like cysteine rich domain protein n=1 Tax=Ancylostoma caninum TaxID=29170 RepID=A0A368EWG7_ANCCA|nr:trypsin Inhibitor like cysteine rich domain protein [Ancylostoma caninum]
MATAPKYGKASTNTYVDEPITPPPKTTQNYVDEPNTKCSVNETLNECGNICEGKCENIAKGPIACPAVCEPPACACKDGYFRSKGGNCVTAIDCSLGRFPLDTNSSPKRTSYRVFRFSSLDCSVPKCHWLICHLAQLTILACICLIHLENNYQQDSSLMIVLPA